MSEIINTSKNIKTIRTETLTDADTMLMVEMFISKGYEASLEWDGDAKCYVMTMTKKD